MATAMEHYDQLLAEHYTWMSGGLTGAVARSKEAFQALGIAPRDGARALDLGAGFGAQSLALSQLGFEVWALDSSPPLLAELSAHASADRVHAIEGDMMALVDHCPAGGVDLVVCMGDSLLHLRSAQEVEQLLSSAARCLRPGGDVLVSFRDLTQELTGAERAIPVRSDDTRIMTCFLEYFDDHVMVHDLVYVRESDRTWSLSKSAYPKLRLGAAAVRGSFEEAGMSIVAERLECGLVTVHARTSK